MVQAASQASVCCPRSKGRKNRDRGCGLPCLSLQSVIGARGFKAGFLEWWKNRLVKLVGSPQTFPSLLPSFVVCELLFQDFRSNYKAFESWHIRHRSQVLAAQYSSACDVLVKDLREPAPEQVDTLVVRRTFELEDADPQCSSIRVEGPLDWRGHSEWQVDGTPVSLVVDPPVWVSLDSVLEQSQLLTEATDVIFEFEKLWTPRWGKHASDSEEEWSRITAFGCAFLPQGRLDLAPITCQVWLSAVKRLKLRAARGPDAFARADLLHMPPAQVDQLWVFLRKVETMQRPWPDQMLAGQVISLCKQNGRTDCQGYRPIVLLSVVYRIWAGIRARQLIRFLSSLLPDGVFGFLPGRETSELWLQVEANIPRRPLFAILSHLGVAVRKTVGGPILSTSGFPEGCPLSPAAMLVVNLLYVRYMAEFCPAVRSMSYADNLTGSGGNAYLVVKSLQTTEVFCEALGLELDTEKTYTWSTCPTQRRLLKATGHAVVESARELGGIFSFCAAVRNRALQRRFQSLAGLWTRLARSKAPLRAVLLPTPTSIAFVLPPPEPCTFVLPEPALCCGSARTSTLSWTLGSTSCGLFCLCFAGSAGSSPHSY